MAPRGCSFALQCLLALGVPPYPPPHPCNTAVPEKDAVARRWHILDPQRGVAPRSATPAPPIPPPPVFGHTWLPTVADVTVG